MAAQRKPKISAYKVGQHVRVRLGASYASGIVIEDRGELGPKHSRLFRIELDRPDEGERADQFEVPADALTAD